MFYPFPSDITLDEVRAATKAANTRLGSPVFLEIDRGEFVVFNYMISFREVWDFPENGMDREHAILRECRGLIFRKCGTLVGRRLHKFYNVNERPETQIDTIDWSKSHVVLEKLDGSFLTPLPVGDWPTDYEIKWATKLGITEVAEKVNPFIARNPQYDAFAKFCLVNEITPIFEFCSMAQRIVIAYPRDRLVLLAARNNRTGTYYGRAQLEDWASVWGVELVAVHSIDMTDPKAAINAVRDLKGEEGVIVRFNDGHMVKIKADEYCLIHGTVSDIVSEKNVINLIVFEGIDDALPLLPDDGRAQVEEFIAKFNAGIDESAAQAEMLAQVGVETIGLENGRVFAEYVAAQPVLLRKAIFHSARGQDARVSIMKSLETSIGSNPKIDSVRSLWGGHKWTWNGQIPDDE